MNIVKQHIINVMANGKRLDDRSFEDYRAISIEYDISPHSAEGSARVKIGGTEVVAGIKTEVGVPYPDSPDQGTIIVNVELTPLSNREFETGPPNIDAIELSRVVDRGIRECQFIDFKKLCLVPKEKVWNILIDIYPINDAGNLFDACALAAVAAIKNANFPVLDDDYKVNYREKTNKNLPLQKYTPISCTVFKIGNWLFVDSNYPEQENLDARLTVVSIDDGSLCALQKGGDVPFTPEEILRAIDLAIKKGKEIRKFIK